MDAGTEEKINDTRERERTVHTTSSGDHRFSLFLFSFSLAYRLSRSANSRRPMFSRRSMPRSAWLSHSRSFYIKPSEEPNSRPIAKRALIFSWQQQVTASGPSPLLLLTSHRSSTGMSATAYTHTHIHTPSRSQRFPSIGSGRLRRRLLSPVVARCRHRRGRCTRVSAARRAATRKPATLTRATGGAAVCTRQKFRP